MMLDGGASAQRQASSQLLTLRTVFRLPSLLRVGRLRGRGLARPGPCRLVVVGALPPPVNGMTTATELLLTALRRSEVRVDHVDTSDHRSLESLGVLDFRNVAQAARSGFLFVLAVVRNRPDAVYVPVAQNTLGFVRDALFLLPARMLGVPVIVHLHGGYFDRFFDSSPNIVRLLIKSCFGPNVFGVVLGESLRHCLSIVVAKQRISVIPNGIDPSGYELAAHRDAAINVRVLYLGTLTASKGFLDVVRAGVRVLSVEPKIRFVFAGETNTQDELETARQIVKDSGLERSFEWHGVVRGHDKTRLLAGCDVFVFPSQQIEGQPFVVLEAMASALPIITTNQGAIGEMIVDGVNGLIVPQGDIGAIADRILKLAGDPYLRRHYGSLARETLIHSYTLDRWEGSIMSLFQRVMSGQENEG